jgi:hypothetical protein
MPTEWSSFWLDVRNLRWGAVDQVILERVAGLLGRGPARTLVELGAGRGEHSRRLHDMACCDRPDVFDPCPEAYEYMRSTGLAACRDESDLKPGYDIVWSNGLIEHFFGEERQAIVTRHFRLSQDWVLIVVPRRNWQRKVWRPRQGVPHQVEYTDRELRDRLLEGAREAWGRDPSALGADSFCPLFGVRHIPDGLYPLVDKLAGWALPGGLLIGWARKGTGV